MLLYYSYYILTECMNIPFPSPSDLPFLYTLWSTVYNSMCCRRFLKNLSNSFSPLNHVQYSSLRSIFIHGDDLTRNVNLYPFLSNFDGKKLKRVSGKFECWLRKLKTILRNTQTLVAENSKGIAENSKGIAENSKGIADNSKGIADNSKWIADNSNIDGG